MFGDIRNNDNDDKINLNALFAKVLGLYQKVLRCGTQFCHNSQPRAQNRKQDLRTTKQNYCLVNWDFRLLIDQPAAWLSGSYADWTDSAQHIFSSTYNFIKFYAYLNLKLVLTYFLSVKFSERRPQHFSCRHSVARALFMELVGVRISIKAEEMFCLSES